MSLSAQFHPSASRHVHNLAPPDNSYGRAQLVPCSDGPDCDRLMAPLISATLLAQWSIWAVGAYLCLLAGVSIVSTLVLPETKGRDLLTRSDA